MRILVIDDSPWNQDSARETLQGHDLTVVGDAPSALTAFWKSIDCCEGRYDAIFTTLHVHEPDLLAAAPKGYASDRLDSDHDEYASNLIAASAIRIGGSPQRMPFGLYMAFLAIKKGIRHVALCADDHDRFLWGDVFELLRDRVYIHNLEDVALRRYRVQCTETERDCDDFIAASYWDFMQNEVVWLRLNDRDEFDRYKHLHVKDWDTVLKRCRCLQA